uniref:Uncharacterized protein n=1 Tax=Desertifilum tharense IPPAS B-1220 TaxID=1781255 RepID=A0ACD5GNI2_9CYAN
MGKRRMGERRELVGNWELGVGEEEDGEMGRWGDGGKEGSWELGVKSWGI